MNDVRPQRRSIPDRLRHLAERLRAGEPVEAVALTLEMTAGELDGIDGPHDFSRATLDVWIDGKHHGLYPPPEDDE
jgi:hypothetical protein